MELKAKEVDKKITRGEYMTQMPAAIQRVVVDVQPEFAKLLTNEQNDRMLQIRWQLLGIQDPTLLKSLNLSAEQLEKLKQIEADWLEKQKAVSNEPDRIELLKKWDHINHEKLQAMEALLTEEQRKQVAQAKGKDFDLSCLRRGFGPFNVAPPQR